MTSSTGPAHSKPPTGGATRLCLLSCFLPVRDHVQEWVERLSAHLDDLGFGLVVVCLDAAPHVAVPAFKVPHLLRSFAAFLPEFDAAPWSVPLDDMDDLVAIDASWMNEPAARDSANGARALAGFARHLAHTLRPDVTVVWGSSLAQSLVLERVHRASGIPTQVLERGLLPDTLMLEPRGNAADSELATSFSLRSAIASGPTCGAKALRSYCLARRPAKYHQGDYTSPDAYRDAVCGGPAHMIAFLGQWDAAAGVREGRPAANLRHGGGLPTTEIALDAVLRWARALGNCRVVFKAHPRQPATACGDDVLVVDPDVHLHTLLEAADVVVGQHTTALIEGLLFGKPLVSLAPGILAAVGAAYHAGRAEDVPRALDAALGRLAFEARLKAGEALLSWLARHALIGTSAEVPVEHDLGTLAAFLASMALPPRDARPVHQRIVEGFGQAAFRGDLHGFLRRQLRSALAQAAREDSDSQLARVCELLALLGQSPVSDDAASAPAGLEVVDFDAVIGLATTARRSGHHAAALQLLSCLNAWPAPASRRWVLDYALASLRGDTGAVDEARAGFDALLRDDTPPPREVVAGALYHLATLAAARDVPEAIALLSRCLALLPDHAAAAALRDALTRRARQG